MAPQKKNYLKNKKLLAFMLCLVLGNVILLSGCKKTDIKEINLTYKGESRNWTASYHVKGKAIFTESNDKKLSYKGDGKGNFILVYKGDLSELNNVKELKYSFERIGGGFTADLHMDEPLDKKVFSHTDSNMTNIYDYNKDRILRVVVTWDGDNGGTETIEFKNQ